MSHVPSCAPPFVLLVAAWSLAPAEPRQEPALDAPFVLVLGPEDAPLAEHGPGRRLPFTADFAGTFCVWVDGPAGRWLALEDASGRRLAQDDDADKRTPCVATAVEPGTTVQVLVAASAPGTGASLTLHLRAARESESTRAAAAATKELLAEVQALHGEGEGDAARELLGSGLHELIEAEDEPQSRLAVVALRRLATLAYELGAEDVEYQARKRIVAQCERTQPRDHPRTLEALSDLGIVYYEHGELAEALAVQEEVFATRCRCLPEDAPDLISAKQELAGTRMALGDLKQAPQLLEEVLQARLRTLPADDADVQLARMNLAIALKLMGDPQAAWKLEEELLQAFERAPPSDPGDRWRGLINASASLIAMGELQRARSLIELALEGMQVLPSEHLMVQTARFNLATVLAMLGDGQGARELFELVLERRRAVLPADHPEVLAVLSSLGAVLLDQGDVETASALFSEVYEAESRRQGENALVLQTTRMNHAIGLMKQGNLERAQALQEEVIIALSRSLSEEDPLLQHARLFLARIRFDRHDAEGAAELEQSAVETLSRIVPAGYRHLCTALNNHAWTLAVLGDRAGCVRTVSTLCENLRARIQRAALCDAPRQAEECAASLAEHVSGALSLSSGARRFGPSPELESDAFHLVEAARSAGLRAATVARAASVDEMTIESRRELQRAGAEVARLAQAGASQGELSRARLELEAAQRALLQRHAEIPAYAAFSDEPEAGRLSSSLAQDDALVGFWAYGRVEFVDATTDLTPEVPSLCAFVVRPGGRLARVELGPLAPIQARVEAWLAALKHTGEPSSQSRAESSAGIALRELVLDPLLPQLGDARHLTVALDDVLHTVPIDALPLGDGLVGERFRIDVRASLRELLWPAAVPHPAGALVAFGGIDYDEPPRSLATADGSVAPATDAAAVEAAVQGGADAAVLRSGGSPRSFPPLTASLYEVREIERLFRQRFGEEAVAHRVEASRASRATLEELAPSARWLHLATHGWFAPESVRSNADPQVLDARTALFGMTREEQIVGSSPLLLCGLALAGANRGETNLFAQVAGTITAEELATLDLSHCELAVLSACDTNVGVRRAGQGVASLQKALQMAGARTVVTSLWKVPDDATRRLMEGFYRRLWLDEAPKARALWDVKMDLRAARDADGHPLYPTLAWAGWVLTGDPR